MVVSNGLIICWNYIAPTVSYNITFPITFTKIFDIKAQGIAGRFTAIIEYTLTTSNGWISDNYSGEIFVLVTGF